MAKAKRGPGRPKKTLAPEGKKRGRKPGIKNKSFMEKVSILADNVEAAIDALTGTLNETVEVEPMNPMLVKGAGFAQGLKETLHEVIGALSDLPSDFVPGKKTAAPLDWAPGAFVVFTHDALKAAMPDAYEVLEVINLGKGPGNGTMLRIEKGMFPKGQLELIDGSTLEDAEPRVSAPSIAPKAKNGVVPSPVAIPVAKQPDMSDDLNA